MISYFKRLWACQECYKREQECSELRQQQDNHYKRVEELMRESIKMTEVRRNLNWLCADLINFIVNESSNSKKLKGASNKIKEFKEKQRKLDEDWQEVFEGENKHLTEEEEKSYIVKHEYISLEEMKKKYPK